MRGWPFADATDASSTSRMARASRHVRSHLMRLDLVRSWVVALVLGPCTCQCASDGGTTSGRPSDTMHLPRISIAVEVELFGAEPPSVRVEIARSPMHPLR